MAQGDLTLRWTINQPGPRQAPVAQTRIDGRLVGIPDWTSVDTVEAPDAELVIQQVQPGRWEYRAVAMDADGNTPATFDPSYEHPSVQVAVPFEGMATVSDLVAELE